MYLSTVRRFPWEELTFNRPLVPAEQERNQRPRAEREDHYNIFKEDDHRRRTPSFSRDKPLGHQRPSSQEEFHHQRRDRVFCDIRKLSPPHDGGGRGAGVGSFNDGSRIFDFRGRSPPPPPLRLPRERLPPTPRHQSHRQQREAGTGWRREEPGRDHNRFRGPNRSPGPGPGPGLAGWSDSRKRNPPGSYREKQRGDGHQEKSPPLKRPRRQQEDGGHSG